MVEEAAAAALQLPGLMPADLEEVLGPTQVPMVALELLVKATPEEIQLLLFMEALEVVELELQEQENLLHHHLEEHIMVEMELQQL